MRNNHCTHSLCSNMLCYRKCMTANQTIYSPLSDKPSLNCFNVQLVTNIICELEQSLHSPVGYLLLVNVLMVVAILIL